MHVTFGRDPVREEVEKILRLLEDGELVDHTFETSRVDLKEEAGRRGPRGEVLPGAPNSEEVAKQLAAEAACMANTPGGGALIVGISNRGELIGAAIDAEWLRYRIYEITEKRLTPDVRELHLNGTRLVVIISPASLEPIRINHKITWRVGDRCLEVDATTWHESRLRSLNYDWSAASSGVAPDAVRPAAIQVARDFIAASGEERAEELSQASEQELLRRLNVIAPDGSLTNAGMIAFVGLESPLIDYTYREVAGADSQIRLRKGSRSLLEVLQDVFSAVDVRNQTRHVQSGIAVRQVQDLPRLAAREAIVNSMAHRDWAALSKPTVVEHIGRTLRVTNPGGFVGGVNENNILTHPSQSRNPSLAQLLADLYIAEREGIGVDRMVREMIRVGHDQPEIREIEGPYVRASLQGDVIDVAWMEWLNSLSPSSANRDVSILLILRRLVREGWVDARVAAPIIQLAPGEAAGVLTRMSGTEVGGAPLILPVQGTPEDSETAWQLSPNAVSELRSADAAAGSQRRWPSRRQVALSFARGRGRISTTELGSLVGASNSNVGHVLKQLAQEGVLEPSSPSGRGRGFFYRWADSASDHN